MNAMVSRNSPSTRFIRPPLQREDQSSSFYSSRNSSAEPASASPERPSAFRSGSATPEAGLMLSAEYFR